MDLDRLKGFVETAREKSFTRAAEKLFLTQPAVSLQVKALEDEFGEDLFERRGKQILLTGAGRLLFARAEAILADGRADSAGYGGPWRVARGSAEYRHERYELRLCAASRSKGVSAGVPRNRDPPDRPDVS